MTAPTAPAKTKEKQYNNIKIIKKRPEECGDRKWQ